MKTKLLQTGLLLVILQIVYLSKGIANDNKWPSAVDADSVVSAIEIIPGDSEMPVETWMTQIFFGYSDYEISSEESITIESWMLDFNSDILLDYQVVEIDPSIEIENWMIDSNLFNCHKIAIQCSPGCCDKNLINSNIIFIPSL